MTFLLCRVLCCSVLRYLSERAVERWMMTGFFSWHCFNDTIDTLPCMPYRVRWTYWIISDRWGQSKQSMTLVLGGPSSYHWRLVTLSFDQVRKLNSLLLGFRRAFPFIFISLSADSCNNHLHDQPTTHRPRMDQSIFN